MTEHDHRIAMLNRLKLTALRDQLDSLIDEAGRRELTIRESPALFCEREIARRDQRRIDMGFGLARFPFVRALAGFDFAAQPSLDKAQIPEIATGRFIANGEAVLFLGPPGVGKTHLAVAIGREAIVADYSVLFSPATTLVAQLARSARIFKAAMAVIGSVVKLPNTESPLTRKRNPQPQRVRNFHLWYKPGSLGGTDGQ
jgi:DNA replication protein DnaC